MIGIDPATIVPLALDAGEPSYASSAASRFAAASAEWIEDCFGADDFDWQTNWRYAPYELLARALSREELIRLWHAAVLLSKVDDHLREHDELSRVSRGYLYAPPGGKPYDLPTCTLPVMLKLALFAAGKSPCDERNQDRAVCDGEPRERR